MTAGVRPAVSKTLAGIGRTVGTAVMTAGVRPAVSKTLAGIGRTVGTAVMTARVRPAVSDALSRTAWLAGDVIVVDCHAVSPSSRTAPEAAPA
jgi:hypothetical protein